MPNDGDPDQDGILLSTFHYCTCEERRALHIYVRRWSSTVLTLPQPIASRHY
ncbi:hypothetical protein ARMGADRAFT_1016841 [Armillaria gallica]|uniref:Uncharacterized protein n=1 Tax=Armillaria gallica TaxID=47427 RepID=A0A2H3CWH8_ARMGA|nr:hypothetical protein ARMGADRAFT_1016841 [Armillaria gallica]